MQTITDLNTLEMMKTEGAVAILFGGARCAVCQSLRPQLASKIDQHFPEMRCVYIDCEKAPDICAQHGVFSLPAVKVFIEGMLVTEDARVFSLGELMQRLERPYAFWQDQAGR